MPHIHTHKHCSSSTPLKDGYFCSCQSDAGLLFFVCGLFLFIYFFWEEGGGHHRGNRSLCSLPALHAYPSPCMMLRAGQPTDTYRDKCCRHAGQVPWIHRHAERQRALDVGPGDHVMPAGLFGTHVHRKCTCHAQSIVLP